MDYNVFYLLVYHLDFVFVITYFHWEIWKYIEIKIEIELKI